MRALSPSKSPIWNRPEGFGWESVKAAGTGLALADAQSAGQAASPAIWKLLDLTSTRSPAHSYSSWRLLPVLDTDIAPSAPPLSSFSVSADGCRALPYPETQPSLWRSLGFVRRDLTFMARWPNGPPIHGHPTLHAADKHRWLPRPSKYRGRRHTKRASRLDWSRMGGRARVELRKTSQQAFPTRS